jgi:hypothetical protein
MIYPQAITVFLAWMRPTPSLISTVLAIFSSFYTPLYELYAVNSNLILFFEK